MMELPSLEQYIFLASSLFYLLLGMAIGYFVLRYANILKKPYSKFNVKEKRQVFDCIAYGYAILLFISYFS